MAKLTFANAPLEILQLIFKFLKKADVLTCKEVCKVWYKAFHQLIGATLLIRDADQFKACLQTVRNRPLYGNGMRSIKIDFRSSAILKILSNDNTCKALRTACPNVETISCYGSRVPKEYFQLLYQFRDTIKHIDLLPEPIGRTNQLVFDPYFFIGSFPQLKTLDISRWNINSVHGCLPLFEHRYELEILKCQFSGQRDSRNVFSKYFENKSDEETSLMLNKLSALRYLELNLGYSCNAYVIVDFIRTYLTGLISLKIQYDNDDCQFTGNERAVLFRNLLHSACTLNYFKLEATSLPDSYISRHLASTIKSVYYRKDSGNRETGRKLKLSLVSTENHNAISIRCDDTSPTVSTRVVHLECTYDFQNGSLWNQDLRLSDVNSFEFELKMHPSPVVFVDFFKALDRLPKLKRLRLIVPFDTWSTSNSGVYPTVSTLQIRNSRIFGTGFTEYAANLENTISMFPNLKHLELKSLTSRINSVYKQVCWYKLDKYELRTLDIGLENVSDGSNTNVDYLFELTLLNNCKNFWFNVNIKERKLKRITERESETINAYIRFRITIGSLNILMIHGPTSKTNHIFESKVVLM